MDINQIDDLNFIDDHLTQKPHLRERHLNLSDTDHARRIANETKTRKSSCFYSEQILQDEIKKCIKDDDNMDLFINWLSSDQQWLNLIYTNGTTPIGIGLMIHPQTKRLTEYTTRTTLVRLRKDPNVNDGFAIITAFPVLTRTGTPTGRDVSHLIKETKLYKEASPLQKIALEIANSPDFNPETMNIQSTSAEIKLQEHTCESIIQSKSIVYHPDENTVKTNTPMLYQITEQTRTRIGLNKPATQPEKKQDQPLETTMANGLSHTPTKIPKTKQVGMDTANDPLSDPKTMDIQTTKDKIQLQEQSSESEITYEAATYLPDETQIRNRRPNLYQLAKNAIKEAITKVTEKVIKRKPKDTTPPDEIRSQPETQTKKPEPDTDDPNDKQEHEKETVETRSAPRIFRNRNNMINPEDDIELYEDPEPYDPLGHNTDPEHTEYMQKLITKSNPHHNDHTQVPEKKYNPPDNNEELINEMIQDVKRMEKDKKKKNLGLGE